MRGSRLRWVCTLALALALTGCTSPETDPQEWQEREFERIATLGYIVDADADPALAGVTVNEPEAYGGHTLFTVRDRPAAFLVDMAGEVVGVWSAPLSYAWSRAVPFGEDGVLAITLGRPGLMLVTPDGVQWHRRELFHHDVQVRGGRIYALMREWNDWPELADVPVAEDFVVELTADGEIVRKVSLLGALWRSERYRNLLDVLVLPEGTEKACDIFHTNSLEVFGDSVLVSLRNISTLAVVSLRDGEVVWALTGMWRKQHEARFTDRGIMLFDNLGHGGRSKVLEFDPATQAVVWQYDAPEFFTKMGGAQQVLPNGNVLITETQTGRIFEVTREGRTVWEYHTPFRTEEGVPVRIMRALRVRSAAP